MFLKEEMNIFIQKNKYRKYLFSINYTLIFINI